MREVTADLTHHNAAEGDTKKLKKQNGFQLAKPSDKGVFSYLPLFNLYVEFIM